MWKITLLVPLILCGGCSESLDDSYVADCCYYIPYLSDCFDYESKTIEIQTQINTNSGAPTYLMIKTTSFAEFLLESYPQITQLIANPEEALASLCLFPGETRTLKLKLPEEEPIAFYALFTNPGKDWKLMIEPKEEFKKILLLLGENEISSINVE